MTSSQHVYEVRPRSDKRGCDLTSDALPFGRLWYRGPKAIRDAIGYAKFFSRSHDAVIRVYDDAGKVIGAHEQAAISNSSKVDFFVARCVCLLVTLRIRPTTWKIRWIYEKKYGIRCSRLIRKDGDA